jgi:hypothetical protein
MAASSLIVKLTRRIGNNVPGDVITLTPEAGQAHIDQGYATLVAALNEAGQEIKPKAPKANAGTGTPGAAPDDTGKPGTAS